MLKDASVAEYIVPYDLSLAHFEQRYSVIDRQSLGGRFMSIYVQGIDSMNMVLKDYYFGLIPSLYSLMDVKSMEASGIIQVQQSPYLELTGKGILIGIIDTGIDYLHPAFIYEDGHSKISALWDQTLDTGPTPEGMIYGTYFEHQLINDAIASEDPYAYVPSKDDSGHGTFLAGLAAGRRMPDENFTGAAPDASLCVVKLKGAKDYLCTFFGYPKDVAVYQENDIMAGVLFLVNEATRQQKPIVILIGLGTSLGSHTGQSALGQMVADLGNRIGISFVMPAGNEGHARHHYQEVIRENEPYHDVELHIGHQVEQLSLQLWAMSPDRYSIELISPAGERTQRLQPDRLGGQQRQFLLNKTELFVYYEMTDVLSGHQMIFVRLQKPLEGIWTIRIFCHSLYIRPFHIWLPVVQFISEDVFFLKADPDVTLVDNACIDVSIVCGAYDTSQNSLYLATGRGWTADQIQKPDITAPGVMVSGPDRNKSFRIRSGTSVAAAITAGAAALIFEWGIVKGNDPWMSGMKVRHYLTLGAGKRADLQYPNRQWGFGTLNLADTFSYLLTEQTK